ncbi:MAG: hypothetical protein LQ347_002667 [Umbilicaria vellea]|nr:MAG: hypothetical protein LQ347_002667 [Umbilicaria vellea]
MQICRFLALVDKGTPLKEDHLADELGTDCETALNGCTIEENMLSILVERLQQGVFIIRVRETKGALAEQLLEYFRIVMTEADRWVSYLLERVEHSVQDGTKLSIALTSKLDAPGWRYLHSLFVDLESLQLISFFLEDAVARVHNSNYADLKPHVKDAAPLKAKIQEAVACIRQAVTRFQKQLRGGGVVSELVEASIGHPENQEDTVTLELRNLLGESWVEIKGADLLASWEDALNGVLRVKLA